METVTHGQILARFGHALSDPTRTQILLTLLVVGLVVFKVLPSIADWGEVADALQSTEPADFVLVIVVALLLEVLKALEQQILIPKLGIRDLRSMNRHGNLLGNDVAIEILKVECTH